jgi:hypothetical protein
MFNENNQNIKFIHLLHVGGFIQTTIHVTIDDAAG